MPLGRGIDNVLEAIKWPIGVVVAVLTLPLCYAVVCSALRVWTHPWGLLWFGAGILLYSLLWRPFGRKRFQTDWLLGVEHEMTHALFAWLTGHRVKSFKFTEKGGKVEVIGGSNWLIALAPYFFPTAPLVLLLVSLLMPLGMLFEWVSLFLGFAMAYHVRSTWTETHGAQSEFDQAGRWFTAIFLPGANLLAMGLVASFAVGGWDEMAAFLGDARAAVDWFIGLFYSADAIDIGTDVPEQTETNLSVTENEA